MLARPEVAVEHPLLARISDARRRSDDLFEIVQPAALYDRPIPERHRIIFYIGHLEAFDWNLLYVPLRLKTLHPEFDRLFAFGIDPVSGGLPTDQPRDWPALTAVHDYVAKVRSALDEVLSMAVFHTQEITRDGFPLDTLVNVAIEHRLMHVETLTYMLHQLPLERKVPEIHDPVILVSPVTPQMVPIPSGTVELGLSRSSQEFGWDNEYESYAIDVPACEMDRYMVTNGQFLDFVHAGGYEARDLWSEGAWNWKEKYGISHPVFWKHAHNRWLVRTMFDEVPLPLDWPVYVSHAEAAAYARWAGKKLPTEEQWHRAAYGTRTCTRRRYPWGDREPDDTLGNFDLHRWDPAPVNAYPESASDFGVEGLLGNGWEWTSTEFAPLPGFEPFPFYRGYSADFFDNKHFVMKGGSARTAACMLRPTFRNWFQAHYQYVYAGFRCVKS